MKFNYAFFLVACVAFCSCIAPLRSFKRTPKPAAPDYAKSRYWAALPQKKDSADFELLKYGIKNNQQNALVDVFFVSPTNYQKGNTWNVSLEDSVANGKTDNVSCRLLASAYNYSCKVYVPQYRAAILYSYFASKKNARLSFGLAYEDVKNAFLYYLKHYNKGRPIIIASHSQGTDHAIRLVKEFFDKDTVLKDQLVAAYLVGRPIYDTTFKQITLMKSPAETGGYVVWNSVSYNTNTFYAKPVGKIMGINPLTWKNDTGYVPAKFNKGSLPFTADRIDTAVADARLAPSGFLWVHRPDNRITSKEYPSINSFYFHKLDYAFFYMNLRENVELRVNHYLKQKIKR